MSFLLWYSLFLIWWWLWVGVVFDFLGIWHKSLDYLFEIYFLKCKPLMIETSILILLLLYPMGFYVVFFIHCFKNIWISFLIYSMTPALFLSVCVSLSLRLCLSVSLSFERTWSEITLHPLHLALGRAKVSVLLTVCPQYWRLVLWAFQEHVPESK